MGKNGERKVIQVMITCPKTGKEVATGVLTMKAIYEAQDYINMKVTCPVCGEVHIWSKKDSFLK